MDFYDNVILRNQNGTFTQPLVVYIVVYDVRKNFINHFLNWIDIVTKIFWVRNLVIEEWKPSFAHLK